MENNLNKDDMNTIKDIKGNRDVAAAVVILGILATYFVIFSCSFSF